MAVPPIRILIADDHPLMRQGIAALLAEQPDFRVVAEAGDGADAVAQFAAHAPNVCVIDLQMPHGGGMAAIEGIRRLDPGARIIVLSTYGGDARMSGALCAGATAYLLKDVLGQELVATVRAVHGGSHVLSPALRRDLARHAACDALTPRELDVLRLAACGRSNREIGLDLSISEATVKTHMSAILAKLGASDRAHAVTLAVLRGFITL